MPVTAYKIGGTYAGTATSPGDVSASDDTEAVANTGQTIIATNFDFGLPAGATIDGVEVNVESRVSSGTWTQVVQLYDASAAIGTSKSTTGITSTTKESRGYGGASDVWSASLTQAIINGTGFGVRLTATRTAGTGGSRLRTDYLEARVHYTEAVGEETLTADTGTFALTGIAAGLLASRQITAETGTFALSGIDAGLALVSKITADTGVFTLSGITAGLLVSRQITADTGTFALSGIDAGLTYSGPVGPTHTLAAVVGTFTFTGIAAALELQELILGVWQDAGVIAAFDQNVITAEVGSFTLTGVAAGLVSSRVLTADVGEFTLTGIDASLALASVLTAEVGSFALTGIDAEFAVSRVLTADTGAFVLTGNAADLAYSADPGPTATLIANTGLFALTGIDAGLFAARLLSADAGEFDLDGIDAGLFASRLMAIAVGEFTLTGIDAELVRSQKVLTAETGALVLTGNAAILRYSEGGSLILQYYFHLLGA